MIDKKDFYPKPKGKYIDRGPESEKLYEAEEMLMHASREACERLRLLLKIDKNDYWRLAVPEHILSFLDSYEKRASIAAAIAYLEKNGFKVEKESK